MDRFELRRLAMGGIVKFGKDINKILYRKTIRFDKSKTLRILNNLVDKNIISKSGGGVAVTYKLK